MHPAKSVIFFTTSSGAGYGLFMVLVFILNLNLLPLDPNIILLAGAGSFLMVTFGLLSSTFHLGHPERAWRALSQWRSSWLSREGILAIVTYLPAIIYVFEILYEGNLSSWVKAVGWVAALLCLLTVYSTSMIYKSLKPIAAWANGFTPLVYMIMSLTSGVLIFNFLFGVYGVPLGGMGQITIVALLLTAILKVLYWNNIDKNDGPSNIGTATGLGEGGVVSPLEHPHTEDNYLLKEMGFRVGRKHSKKLRKLFFSLWTISALLILIPYFFPINNLGLISLAPLMFAGLAILVERWLFFAEAKHTVALYYHG